jgi:nicotinamide riboside transporter PnuC
MEQKVLELNQVLITLISWILTTLSVIGAIRNAQGKIDGFYIWVVSNVGWVVYDIVTNQPAQIALFSVYTLITLYGIYKWSKKKKLNK